MSLDGLIAVGIIAGVVVALVTNRVAVELAMFSGLALLILAGTVEPSAALSGFSHPAPISIASLFVVAAGLHETGATVAAAPYLLGRPKSLASAQFRLMIPVAVLSAFINNTPVVAMYLPIVRDWADRIRVSSSQLLIPLSFASILGGQLTVIGSASNLIVMGLYLEYLSASGLPAPGHALKFWGPALLGLPAAVVGVAYLMALSRALIPNRLPMQEATVDAEQYTVQMNVPKGSPLAGATIASSGLSQHDGLGLYEIERDGRIIPHPEPDTPLLAGDRLGFAGNPDAVVELLRVRGLAPPEREKPGAVTDPGNRELVEAVVAAGSRLAGKTVRESTFGTLFHAAVVAVRRSGVTLRQAIADIRLEPGDTLLLEAPKGFARANRSSSHFYLLSIVPGFEPTRHNRLGRSALVFCLLVVGLTTGYFEPVVVCLTAALLMVVMGCITSSRALAEISLPVIITIATSIGMGMALVQTGAATVMATWLLEACRALGAGNRGVLFVIILMATVFSQVIHKNAVAALMFPIAQATAGELNLHLEPFAFSLIFGCGLSFLSPVTYQTNLMVYGPGGYKFLDFPRVGTPLTLLLAVLGAALCPIVFPFQPLP